ncbi:phosphoglycolate phosphatase [Brackiella oedipodis]|uniref:phosphoglycolate phosphatase n=1 Tax=Brackiella oedipodis TaxID=124225 RepID=UPI00048CF774|nr:phosphoglycolate phosphatase [Brackiella oedipodis]
MITTVLFDFDGTLVDSAPDLVYAANQQRRRRGLEPLPYEHLRNFASKGSAGLIEQALGILPQDPEFATIKQQFLDDYEAVSPSQTNYFPGILDLLENLEKNRFKWGIMTNKVEYLAIPIFKHFGLDQRSAVNVCGDTTAHSKPHPLPLLYAAEQINEKPQHCIYIGDDERDIVAGRAAGMKTIAVTYGYSLNAKTAAACQADAISTSPEALFNIIQNLTT